MNREEYKAAFDQISFSPDFQARTQAQELYSDDLVRLIDAWTRLRRKK